MSSSCRRKTQAFFRFQHCQWEARDLGINHFTLCIFLYSSSVRRRPGEPFCPGLYILPCPLLWAANSETSCCVLFFGFFRHQIVLVFVLTLKLERSHWFSSSQMLTRDSPPYLFFPFFFILHLLSFCSVPGPVLETDKGGCPCPLKPSCLTYTSNVAMFFFFGQRRVRTAWISKLSIMLLWHLHLADVCLTGTMKNQPLVLISCVTFCKLINHSEPPFLCS